MTPPAGGGASAVGAVGACASVGAVGAAGGGGAAGAGAAGAGAGCAGAAGGGSCALVTAALPMRVTRETWSQADDSFRGMHLSFGQRSVSKSKPLFSRKRRLSS